MPDAPHGTFMATTSPLPLSSSQGALGAGVAFLVALRVLLRAPDAFLVVLRVVFLRVVLTI